MKQKKKRTQKRKKIYRKKGQLKLNMKKWKNTFEKEKIIEKKKQKKQNKQFKKNTFLICKKRK